MLNGGDVIFNFKGNDKDLQKTISGLGTSIKSMITALGLDRLINKTLSALNNSLDGAIKRVDTLNNFPRVMENLGIATEDSSKAIQDLNDGLQGLPTTLNEGVSAVQRFTSQNNDVNKSTKIFLALNNAILSGGASMEVQSSALEQLSQAYAKGKPDALEWRSILTAMPSQLKQVTKAMGYTSTAVGGDLYEAIQKGKVSMDDFMDTIIRLNEEGVDGFASFSEQAKASTSGIQTSITNIKTAITRGLANSIDSLNESLKKSNLPTISEIFQKIGESISKAFQKVNDGIKKIKWEKIIPVFKEVYNYMKNLKNIAFGFVKEVFKNIDWDMVLKIAPTILNIIATVKILNPLIKTGTTLISGFTNIIKGLSSPVGLVTTLITGLATALTFLFTSESEEQKRMREFREEVQQLKDDYYSYNKAIDENTQKSVSQIDHIKSLSDELKTLVDENGKVKESDKKRVEFILNELNDALGKEYKLVDDIVDLNGDYIDSIDEIIQKKRAEIVLEASSEKAKKGVEARTKAYEELKKIVEQTGLSFEEIEEKIKKVNENIENNEGDLLDNLDWMNTYGDKYNDLVKIVEDANNDMKQYEEDYARFTEGKFDEIGASIKSSTKDWTDETSDQIKKELSEREESLKQSLEIYKKYGEKQHETEVNTNLQSLADLRQTLQARTNQISAFSSTEVEAYIRLAQKDRNAFNNIMSQTSGDTYNQLRAIAEVIDRNGGIPVDSASRVASSMAWQFQNLNSSQWGYDMVSGIASGIRSNKSVINAVSSLASSVTKYIHFSKPDVGPLREYEKWMPDFIQGLSKSLESATPQLYASLSRMAENMKETLSMGFSMSPTLNNTSNYNPTVNVKVYNNLETDFMGNLVSNIKTFSNGSKNDYNYGMGG